MWRENLGLRGLKALPVTFGKQSPVGVIAPGVRPQKGTVA